MSGESEDSNFIYVPEINLIACPFVDLCELPKHYFLCKVPDCKLVCSEYLTKAKKLIKKKIN
ncbi:MAG: hypothetical protein ACW96X_12300 [Promethearchaeota archaeon]|jgi:hypothetical protein